MGGVRTIGAPLQKFYFKHFLLRVADPFSAVKKMCFYDAQCHIYHCLLKSEAC